MTDIDFGMPTLIELGTIEECVSLCIDQGLKFIEVNMNMPQYQVDKLDTIALKKAMDTGIYFTFHLDENFNVADFNSKVSKAYIDTILSVIEIAVELHSPVINVHMPEGIHFKLPNEKVYLFEQYNDFYTDSLLNLRNLCDKAIALTDLKICIENCNGYLPFVKKGIDLLLESQVFQLTFDIGHNYCAQRVDEQFIIDRKERLYHMHIHDAQNNKCHLILGSGDINIKSSLEFADLKKSRCVIETKTVLGLKKSIKYLCSEVLI